MEGGNLRDADCRLIFYDCLIVLNGRHRYSKQL